MTSDSNLVMEIEKNSDKIEVNKIKILVVGDIHEGFAEISDLKAYIENQNGIVKDPATKYIIICVGDLTNVKLHDLDPKNPNNLALSKALNSTQRIFEALLEIEPFDELYVLPGNHDHPFFFKKSIQSFFPDLKNPKQKKILNLETEGLITIDQNDEKSSKLSIFGIGGTVPAFLVPKYDEKQDPKIWKSLDSETIKKQMKVWEGIPYSKLDEEEFAKALDSKLKNCFSISNKSKSQHQIIFCSHMGPWSSTTAIVKDKKEEKNPDPKNFNIMTGSTTLDDLLFDSAFEIQDYLVKNRSDISSSSQNFEKINVLCSIHGHTHNAAPAIEKRKCGEVYNFGALFKGRFGFIELEKPDNNCWSISSSQFCYIKTAHEFVK